MTRPWFMTPYVMEIARRRAVSITEGSPPRPYADVDLARAYLSLLSAVEPLLAAAERFGEGPWDGAAVAQTREVADALRDLLGPTGGEA